MPGGRPRLPGTEEERAQRLRERVRRNVRSHRLRHRHAKLRHAQVNDSGARHVAQGKMQAAALESDQILPVLTTQFANRSATQEPNAYVTWLSERIPFQLWFGPSYQDVLFTGSVRRGKRSLLATEKKYLPVDLACGSWFGLRYTRTNAAQIEQQVLSNLLLSTALRDIKALMGSPHFQLATTQAHSRVVKQLSGLIYQQLDGDRHVDSYALAGKIMAFAMTELVAHSSWERFILHIRGAGAVFEFAGPQRLKSASSRLHFHGFRSLALAFSLMERRRDFASGRQWLNLPPSGPPTDFNVRNSAFLDIMYHMPPLMEAIDQADSGDCALTWNHLRLALDIRTMLIAWKTSAGLEDFWAASNSLQDDKASYSTPFPTDCMTNVFIAFCGAMITVNEMCASLTLRLSSAGDGMAANLGSAFVAGIKRWVERTCWLLLQLSEKLPRNVGKIGCLYSLDAAWKACVLLQADWKEDMESTIGICEQLATHFSMTGFPAFRQHTP